MSIKVVSLFVYPIKSCRGITVPELQVLKNGPKFDRQYMLVDEHAQFLTQRNTPLMGQIDVSILTSKDIVVSLAGEDLTINDDDFSPLPGFEKSRVWKDLVAVKAAPEHVNKWFSAVLRRPCTLVKLATTDARTRTKAGLTQPYEVKFADSAPFLLTSTSSLSDLNGRISGPPMEMERFRPNIVIEGAEAYVEDTWNTLSIGVVNFQFTYPCARCVITTMDPISGKRSAEPLLTLAKYRKSEAGICFGMNLIHANTGSIKIGDTLKHQ